VGQERGLLVGLGMAIRHARAARHLSQEELGLRTGIHRNYIGGIERGERSPSLVTVARLAEGLGLAVWELLRQAEAET
jgi:transcriptional regulator with XRE-family HTH domain